MNSGFILNCINSIQQKLKRAKFIKCDEGSTAVEFALIGVPFFLLLVGLIEMGLYLSAGVVVEGASNHAARVIRTGQAQTSGDPVGMFQQELCEKLNILVSCADLQYEIIESNDGNFSSIVNVAPVFDADGKLVSQGVSVGGADSVIMIRVAYRYKFKTPLLSTFLGDPAYAGTALHLSTVVIRNEPYEF